MKCFPAIALLALAAAIVTPSSQAQGTALKANVPFDFVVGDNTMPAGEYTITTPLSGVIRMVSADGHNVGSVVVLHGSDEARRGSKLVFLRYGDDYFLHQILCSNSAQMNVNIAAWKLEKRAQTREAKLQTGNRVLVAAR